MKCVFRLLPALVAAMCMLPPATWSQEHVIISEFMADNARTLADEDGAYSDWIELHNPTTAAIDLAGYHLTDDPGWLTRWTFPSVTLPAGGYLVVFASGKDRAVPGEELHANFQLAAGGEFLGLVLPDGVTLASVFSPEYISQREDVAYGIAQKPITTALLEGAIPRMLVPGSAGELAAGWHVPAFEPGANWLNGTAPAAVGFDTNQPVSVLVNLAPGGAAVQSTTDGLNAANRGNDGTATTYSATLGTDNAPFWQVTLAADADVHRVVLRNRTSCCQSRLRDVVVQILAGDGITTNFTSAVLNPENAGHVYPEGPGLVELDLASVAGGAIRGRIVRVHRIPDPDLSGTAGQGDSEEAAQLALGEVEVYGVTEAAAVNLARTGSPAPTATQSTTLSGYPANLGIDGNLGNLTHTTSADANPAWTLNLGRMALITSVIVHNRDSCCGSRLRDVTVEILGSDGVSVLYVSPLLNPENAGYSYPNGPDHLLVELAQPVIGQYVRVRRMPDLDLSGTGGQGNTDETAVLSLGEVIVNGSDVTGYRPFIRTDLQTEMLGRNASAFLRLPFVVAAPDLLNALTLQVRYDDGFIAYVNGVKVVERNAPANPAWNSVATAKRDFAAGITPETIDLAGAVAHLVPGTNWLAIQALNVSEGDGNFLLQPELSSLQTETSDYAYLVDATPGYRNETDYYYGEVADTQFSVDRGFFEAPISLEISSATPGAQIYYSFDGSEPGPGRGMLYTGPLTITNTTVVRARAFKELLRATDVDTHSYIFLADVVQQAPTGAAPPYFPASWGANAVNYGMDPNVVSQYTDAEWEEALTQIPTMSIVTAMENLFDPATGIYANALQHGIDWERPGSIELIDPDGAPQSRFQENCGLRIRGGYSRNPQFVKHSLRVFFRREYGAPKLVYPLFEDEGAKEFDTFDLRTSQNYSWPRESNYNAGRHDTLARDLFCRETLGALGQPHTRSRYYHLYINGQYWGIYMTQERPEASYGETYFGGDKDDFDVVKCANHVGAFVTEATDGDLLAFSNLWTMARAHAAAPNNANYFAILGCNADGTRNPALPVMLDVDNLIDYMLEIFYSGDGDAVLSSFLGNTRPNNWFGMRNRKDPNTGFRFINQDSEHTLGSPNSQVDRTGPWRNVSGSNIGNFTYANPQYFHEDLMHNVEYRLRFADHVRRHFFNGGALTPEAATNRFLGRAELINRAIRAYSARWGDAVREPPYNENDWRTEITWIVENWFPSRTATVLQQLRGDDLYPPIDAPVFSQWGGEIAPGFAVALSHANTAGTIYYTLDGSDPRLVGGGVNPAAAAYAAPIPLNLSTRLKARVLSGATWSALSEADFALPGLPDLRLTEIMYHPAPPTAAEVAAGFEDAELFEFIELRNVGPIELNLGGLSLVDGITFTFTGGALSPGGRILLVNHLAAFQHRYGAAGPIAGTYGGRLNNAGERLVLVDSAGRTIHNFSYSDNWYPITDGFGFSLVIVDDTAPLSTWKSKASWRASGAFGGSAGAAEPPAQLFPLVYLNEVLSRPAAGEQLAVEIVNLGSDPADLSGWWLTDDSALPQKFRLPPGTLVPAGDFVVFTQEDFGGAGINLSPAGAEMRLFSADAQGNLTGYYQGWDFGTADEGTSFGRHVISTGADHFVAQSVTTLGQSNAGPRISPVVISEIMYHPPDPDVSDLGEFVEVFNRSVQPVALFDPAAPTNTWRITGGIDFVFPSDVTLAPGEYLLVVTFNPQADPASLAAFRALYAVAPAVRVFGPYAGRLGNGDDSVELRRPTLLPSAQPAFVLADKVGYEDDEPWPPGADGFGGALHRLDGGAYGNDPANWTAARPGAGAAYAPASAPPITVEPASQSVVELTAAAIHVEVQEAGPHTFIWRRNGEFLPEVTGPTLSLESAQLADSGTYTVAVLNPAGAISVAGASLTVLAVPVITTHPQDAVVSAGGSATFTVAATGTGPLSYQWRRNGLDIPGATSATLNVTGATFDVNDGYYTVRVNDEVGSRESAPGILTVKTRPTITQQLRIFPSTNVLEGRTFSFSISASGSWPMGFRFRAPSDGYFAILSAYSNHNAIELVVENAKPALHQGSWDVGITNSGGQALSVRLAVTVSPAAPFFALEPADQHGVAGGQVMLEGEARGTEPISYQWYYNGATPLPEATNATLALLNLQPTDAGSYTVVAANSLGMVTSAVASVTLQAAPIITGQPASQTATVCSEATFTVTATGADLSYQWYFNGTVLPARIDPMLTLQRPGPAQQGDYFVVIAGSSGSVTSEVATLALTLGDQDGDGMPDAWELAHGLDPCDAADRDFDADEDGRSNWEESVSGTDPGSRESVLQVGLLDGGSGGARIQFTAMPEIGYTIQYRTSLSNGAWVKFADILPEAAPHAINVVDPAAGIGGGRFYRIVTPIQP